MIPKSTRAFNILTLIVPSLAAGAIAFAFTERGELIHATAQVLLPLWLIMAGALTVRLIEAAILGKQAPLDRMHGGNPPGRSGAIADQLDILTATGRAVLWTGAFAVAASVYTGWASLAVIGVLGLGSVYVSATWTALVAGGDEPWRAATITRAILPEVATEGDAVREEIRLHHIKIPAGFRLFVSGRSTPHGPVSRYAVGSEASRAEVLLESDLGQATRGEHTAPPLAVWLGDILGLCRTPVARFGEAKQTVLPRPGQVEGARILLGKGRDDTQTVPTRRLPSEGLFRLREYAPGDDTRRIHWVRSLAARQLVVRLPDEIPPAEPAVRLILDSHFVGTESFACRAPQELLDALVRVWLGVGRALVDTGARVTLVAVTRKPSSVAVGDALVATERPLAHRMPKEALRLGARTVWQPSISLKSLLKENTERQIVVSCRPRPLDAASNVCWVVVPEVVWTSPEPLPPETSLVKLAFPTGSAENRFGRRSRAQKRLEAARRDGAIFNDILCWIDWKQLSGAFLARPLGSPPKDGVGRNATRVALEVIP